MSEKRFTVAVAGATGAVGQEMLKVLAERNFPVGEIRLLASERSAGTHLRFRGRDQVVQLLGEDSFAGVQIALFSAGGSVSLEFAPHAVKAGAVVVDNTSAFRMERMANVMTPQKT